MSQVNYYPNSLSGFYSGLIRGITATKQEKTVIRLPEAYSDGRSWVCCRSKSGDWIRKILAERFYQDDLNS